MGKKKNQMVPLEIKEMVKTYLTDGCITPREREVILRRAEKLNLNLDEIDLYIDSEQQKVEQKFESAEAKRRGAVCPFCGSTIPQLADKCPNCGQLVTPQVTEELKSFLEELESASRWSSSKKLENLIRTGRIFYGDSPKIMSLLDEYEKDIEVIIRKEKQEEKQKHAKRRRHRVMLFIVGICYLPFLYKIFQILF